MTLIFDALLIPTLAILCRAHGAGVEAGFPKWGRLASTIAFAIAFGAANYSINQFDGKVELRIAVACVAAMFTVFGLSTGHGRFYAMRGANLNDPNPEQIEKWFVQWWYPGNIAKPLYSWACMGFKGLLIGLAAFPFGPALAVLWPLAYYISFKFWKDSAPAEWLCGGFAGLTLFCAMLAA